MPCPQNCEYCHNPSNDLTRIMLDDPFWVRKKDGTYYWFEDLWYCRQCADQFYRDCATP